MTVYYLNLTSHLLILVQEHFNNQIPPFGMIEKDEKRPMNKPGSLLKSLQWCVECIVVNILLQPIQIFQCSVPILHQDFRGQFSPKPIQVILKF